MEKITVRTAQRRGLVDITAEVERVISSEEDSDGVWWLYVPHTTAGITINEGADPAVAEDILMAWERLVPEDLDYRHLEGNAPAHVLSCIAGSSVGVIVEAGKVKLGTWQSIFFCEFDGPRTRTVWIRGV